VLVLVELVAAAEGRRAAELLQLFKELFVLEPLRYQAETLGIPKLMRHIDGSASGSHESTKSRSARRPEASTTFARRVQRRRVDEEGSGRRALLRRGHFDRSASRYAQNRFGLVLVVVGESREQREVEIGEQLASGARS